ncbi:hypothetical protein SBOR_8127 [Sclerotinia borealis F-4128]|uniref:NmrA-like domain-containing protein n=1 Tax=Sclerotinia borealis (strain F-4128) TaxID=1432307 RepID=W9C6X8_SCLBF|nr:hypothetical protein SBOR_8127 [Sclerotinia borealis F-4128]
MSKIFLIGATGHIGGAVLDLVYPKYPNAEIKALVRDEKKGEVLVGKYPRVKVVIGDFKTLDILTREAKEADLVINAGPDHEEDIAITAILAGLANHSPKTYYIHTSGAALVWDSPDGTQPGTKIWDDVIDIQGLKSFPSTTVHATTDALVFAAAPDTNVAIISPTVVYGLSPSSIHPTPITLPPLIDVLTKLNSGFTLNTGVNVQGYIHVLDLAQIYLLLIDDALKNPSSADPKKWGPESYYFGASEDLSFKEYMTYLVSHLSAAPYNLIQDSIKQLALPDAIEVVGLLSAYYFGTYVRVASTRAKDVLGWVAKEKLVGEGLGEVLAIYFKGKNGGV